MKKYIRVIMPSVFGALMASTAHAQQGVTPTLDNGYATTLSPTYGNNTVQPLSLDANGNLRVTSLGSGSTTNIVLVPSSSSAVGITPCVVGSAASTCSLKSSAGNLYSIYVTPSSTAGYLEIFNSVTAPSAGSTTAGTASGNMEECIYVPFPGTTSANFNPGPPAVFSTGITAVFSSSASGCSALSASATAFIAGSVK